MDTVCVSPEMFFAKSVKIMQGMQVYYDEERLRGDLDFLYYSQFSAPAGQDPASQLQTSYLAEN